MTRAEQRALEAYDTDTPAPIRFAFRDGYEQAEKDILAIIESRISEIIGDAQPKPILRTELQELTTRIKNED